MKKTEYQALGGVQREEDEGPQRQRAERDEQEWKQGATVQGARDGQGVLPKAAQKSRKMNT